MNPLGLSPRVRGNLASRALATHRLGPIPACAGEPWRGSLCRTKRKAYPRVCGGTMTVVPRPGTLWGLSPRVRGNRCFCWAVVSPSGPIPACAGNRSCPSASPVGVRPIPACAGEPTTGHVGCCRCLAYPRVCGGTFGDLTPAAYANGLSPRVRGNRVADGPLDLGYGPIPACAGEPL